MQALWISYVAASTLWFTYLTEMYRACTTRVSKDQDPSRWKTKKGQFNKPTYNSNETQV